MSPTCIIGESDLFLTLLLQRFAEESGMETLHARLGEQALKMVRESPPDVLVIDPELPGTLRGWEVIQAVRWDAQLSAIRIITCAWLDPVETFALTGAAAPHLQKPELSYREFQTALSMPGPRSPAASATDSPAQPADSRRDQ